MPCRRSLSGVVATLALSLCFAAGAEAQTYVINRTDDPPPDACLPADCSLREALIASNESTAVDDLVEIPAAASPYTVDLGQLEITDGVEVRGAGADRVVIDGAEKSLLLSNAAPEAERAVLAGLTLAHGKGAIQNNGPMTLRGVSIERNFRSGAGGGIQSNSPLLIESSFIGFNGTDGISGGGIQSNSDLTLVDSTLAWNESNGPSGINGNDETTLISAAIVFNTSEGMEDAAVRGVPLVLHDSILAENRNATGAINCGEETLSMGGNVEDVSTCSLGAADRPDTDPGLGPLERHGGTTLVHSLMPGGGAVDAATACPAFDQRGAPRPQGPACDSGPFELEQSPTVAPGVDGVVSLGPIAHRLRLNRRGVGRLRLSCPASEESPPCAGSLVLRTRGRVRFHGRARRVFLARARFSIGAGRSKRIRLRLTRAKVALIRSVAAARRALAIARVADAAGNAALLRHRLAVVGLR